jgi:hypothetical protein
MLANLSIMQNIDRKITKLLSKICQNVSRACSSMPSQDKIYILSNMTAEQNFQTKLWTKSKTFGLKRWLMHSSKNQTQQYTWKW